MPEALHDEMAIFLRCAREELLHEVAPDLDPMKPHRARRVAAGLSHLIARSEVLVQVEETLAPRVLALGAWIEATLKKYDRQLSTDLCDPLQRVAAGMHELASVARHSGVAAEEVEPLIRAVRDLQVSRARSVAAAVRELDRRDEERRALRATELPALTEEDVTQFLRRSFPEHREIAIRDFVQPRGVYSKENYRFDIVGLGPKPVSAILRRDRNFEIVPTSAAREFELLNQLHARGLPVARCLAVQYNDTPPLRRPSLLMERVPGSTPSRFDPKSTARLSPDAVTPEMLLQLAATLARLHATPVAGLSLPVKGHGRNSRERFLEILDHYHQQLQRAQREPFPILEASFAWLYANASLIDDVTTLVHADYDLRNVLFDAGRLTAVLDFELAHLGHPAEDLGYLRKDIEGMIPWSQFLGAYVDAGGSRLADELVMYFQVWAYAFHGTCNVTAFSGYRSGVHSDVFLGTLCFIEFEHIQRRLTELLPGDES
jgi:aminoglycoside phosphotransferase